MRQSCGLFGAFLALLLVGLTVSPANAADGQMIWGVHISLASTWFDPAEAPGIITPFYCDISYENLAEAAVNYLKAVGIQLKLRPLERVAFFSQLREEKLSHLIQIGSAAFGNAATRIDAFVAAAGIYTYGTYPDIEGLIQEQASGVGTPPLVAATLSWIVAWLCIQAVPIVLHGIGSWPMH